MVSLGKYKGYDYNWSLSHNASHQPLLYINENIKVDHNSTDGTHPPVVGQNSMFFVVKETDVTVDSNSTDNNVYPANSTVVNYDHEAVFLPAAFTVDWDSTSCSSTGTAGTYYTICKGAENVGSTSIGYGIIEHTTSVTSFSFDEAKGGWYDQDGNKVLARFNSTGGTVDQLTVFYSKTKDRGFYASKGLYFSSTGVYLSKGQFDLNGKTIEFKDDIKIQDTSTGMNNKWFVAYINEADGVTGWTNSTNTSWANYSPSGNQLALLDVFNEARNYCYDTISSNNYRMVATAYMGLSSGTDGEYVFNLEQRPKTRVLCRANSTQQINDNSVTVVNYDTIEYDTLSEVATGSTWTWTAQDAKDVTINAHARVTNVTGAATNEIALSRMYKNGGTYGAHQQQSLGTATALVWQSNISPATKKGDYWQHRVYQNSGNACNLLVSGNDGATIFIKEK